MGIIPRFVALSVLISLALAGQKTQIIGNLYVRTVPGFTNFEDKAAVNQGICSTKEQCESALLRGPDTDEWQCGKNTRRCVRNCAGDGSIEYPFTYDCNVDYSNKEDDVADGCETRNDPDNCGGCGKECPECPEGQERTCCCGHRCGCQVPGRGETCSAQGDCRECLHGHGGWDCGTLLGYTKSGKYFFKADCITGRLQQFRHATTSPVFGARPMGTLAGGYRGFAAADEDGDTLVWMAAYEKLYRYDLYVHHYGELPLRLNSLANDTQANSTGIFQFRVTKTHAVWSDVEGVWTRPLDLSEDPKQVAPWGFDDMWFARGDLEVTSDGRWVIFEFGADYSHQYLFAARVGWSQDTPVDPYIGSYMSDTYTLYRNDSDTGNYDDLTSWLLSPDDQYVVLLLGDPRDPTEDEDGHFGNAYSEGLFSAKWMSIINREVGSGVSYVNYNRITVWDNSGDNTQDNIEQFEITPDSTQVVFIARSNQDVTNRTMNAISRSRNIWVSPIDGDLHGWALSLLPEDGLQHRIYKFQISPDSKWVVFMGDHVLHKRYDLMVSPIQGQYTHQNRRPPAVILHPWEGYGTEVRVDPSFAICPNSKYVVYGWRNDTDSERGIYVSAIDQFTHKVRKPIFHRRLHYNTTRNDSGPLGFEITQDGLRVAILAGGPASGSNSFKVGAEIFYSKIDGTAWGNEIKTYSTAFVNGEWAGIPTYILNATSLVNRNTLISKPRDGKYISWSELDGSSWSSCMPPSSSLGYFQEDGLTNKSWAGPGEWPDSTVP